MNQADAFKEYQPPPEPINYTLRDHQTLAIEMARDSVRKGLNRPIIAAPTSFGKTIVAGQMLKNCQQSGKIGWFMCDRKQLIEQSIDKFRSMGIDFGVRQDNHPLHNPRATVQIASIQTIQSMVKKHKRPIPEMDMMIVDECHTQYEIIDTIMEQLNKIPVIGLSATPYSKGLGNKYNNLLVPITPQELLDKGYLCPVRYFGGEHVNLSKVRSSNKNTYRADDLARESDSDADRLTGCIIRNWLEHGENSQSIAFSPTQNLSKMLVDRFNSNGISAEHIDCNFDQDDRQALFEAHDKGEFKILSCSRLLNTGYDAPSVRCIIDCFPTKSVTVYQQRVGRTMRIFPGKEYAIYLDHADNFSKFGYAEDLVPDKLDMGDKTHNEKELVKKDKKETKKQECPQCQQLMSGKVCKACGFEFVKEEEFIDDGSMLQEIVKDAKKANRIDTKQEKEQFYSELCYYANNKGYKLGWAANQYREKYGVWPNKINSFYVPGISDKTKGWLKHQRIKYAKSKKK